ncbi:MAG TPA: alpha/beta hydrolase [Verrucomicrobia bacterium]|nr:alpha/beta hydrolase [Verrucomicrobiota bacterium]
MTLTGKRSPWLGAFEKYEFEISERPVTVVCPKRPLTGLPWAWKGEFLNAFPKAELALLEAGFHIVYLADPDRFGCPETVRRWDALYVLLATQFGFSRKPALIGLSRGGLYCYQWAIANPEKVACIYGDAPVCDMRSWPGGKGKGPGSPRDWRKVMDVFGYASEEEAMQSGINPVDNLKPLAEHRIPILHVYGDADEVVPWDENTGVVAARYRELGGDIQMIGKHGCKHHPHGLEDCSPIVDFILTHRESLSRGF